MVDGFYFFRWRVRLHVPNAWAITGRWGRSSLPPDHPDRHNSVWTVGEFKSMEYKVEGSGFKSSHILRHYIWKYIPRFLLLFGIIEGLINPVSRRIPEVSDRFYATKDVRRAIQS